MFGTQDPTQTTTDDPAMLDNVKQLTNDDASTQPTPAVQPSTAPNPTQQTVSSSAQTSSEPVSAQPQPVIQPQTTTTEEPVTPLQQQQTTATESDTSADKPDLAQPTTPADPTHLAGMKQQALDHLEPLVDHLDGTPEEVFKTTMMMIQANDNHTLIEKALEAAKKISDDKARAQAMLDIINEVNYFSQNSSADKSTN